MWFFRTPTHPVFNEFYELFYGLIVPKPKRRTSDEVQQLKAFLKEMKSQDIFRTEALGFNHTKHVPSNIVDLMDELALAFWIMGDGGWQGNGVI